MSRPSRCIRFDRASRMTALAGALSLGAPWSAWAQSPQGQQASAAALDAARTACASDLQQFCANVQPGGGRILACLKQHKDQVSPGCRKAVVSALGGAGAGAGGEANVGGSSPAAPADSQPSAAPAEASSTGRPAAPAARTTVARGGAGAAHYFKLKQMKTTVKEEQQGEMTVYTLLAPEDWTLTGGVGTKTDAGSCFSDMLQVSGIVKTADGARGMAVIPRTSFR